MAWGPPAVGKLLSHGAAMSEIDLVAATRALLEGVRPDHLRHLIVVVDDDGPRLEQRSAWILHFRLNDLAPLARELASWRRPGAIPVFFTSERFDDAELRAFNVNASPLKKERA